MFTEMFAGAANRNETEPTRPGFEAAVLEQPKYGDDQVLYDEANGYFGVFDGVGGDAEGGDAALIVRDAFAAHTVLKHAHQFVSVEEAVEVMRGAMIGVRGVIAQEMAPEKRGSTTASVVKLAMIEGEPHLVAGNAGDSRIMLYRNGVIQDVTEEQVVVSRPNMILNAFSNYTDTPELDEIQVVPLQVGDKVVICSDGITGDYADQKLTTGEFTDALEGTDAQTAAAKLLEFSKKSDDKSVIVIVVAENQEVRSLTTSEMLKQKAVRAGAFIAGLGIAQKFRGSGGPGKTHVAAKAAWAKTVATRRRATERISTSNIITAARNKETYKMLSARASERFTKAKDDLMKLYLGVENQIVSIRKSPDELTEKQLQHRRWLLNGAIGVVAAWGLYKAFHGMESANNVTEGLMDDGSRSSNPNQGETEGGTDQPPSGEGPDSGDKPGTIPEADPVPKRLTLEQGDSIWGSIEETAQQRGLQLTDAQVHDMVSRTLQYNDLTWEEARYLPVDYRFDVPEEVRMRLLLLDEEEND